MHPHPQLSIKRFGRTDFERFDQETARGSHLCVGSHRIGKVEIDCKYYWKKAQWGVLGSEARPAGVVYMDINFKQSAGYVVEAAHVFVTVSEDRFSYAMGSQSRRRHRVRSTMASDYAVQITENFGPRLITGEKTMHQTTNTTNLTPTVGLLGIDFGGLGHVSTTFKEKIDAWCFRGSLGRPKNEDGLRTMHWELRENSLNPRQVHSQEYCTAFAFEHSTRPVYMRVEISGTIRGLRGSARNKYERFSSLWGGKDNSTLVLINFPYARQSQKRLDEVARGLDMAMQWENWKKAGVEVPGSLPAQFAQQAKPETAIEDEESRFAEACIERAVERDDTSLEALARLVQVGRDVGPSAVEEMPSRLLADVRRSTDAETPELSIRRGQSGRLGNMAATESIGTRTSSSERDSTTVVNSDSTPSELDDDKLKRIVRIPAILFLIRFLVIVASFFGGDEMGAASMRLEREQADEEERCRQEGCHGEDYRGQEEQSVDEMRSDAAVMSRT